MNTASSVRFGALAVGLALVPGALLGTSVASGNSTPASQTPAAESTAPALPADVSSPFVAGGSDACGVGTGLVPSAVIDGATLCTTGPEPGDPPVTSGGPAPEATAGIQCFGNGSDGTRVQFVYVHPPTVNRLSSFDHMVRARAAQIDAIFNSSAAQTGGRRHVRFQTDPNCNLEILNLTLDASLMPATNFSGLVNAMVSRGYSDPDVKYLIWAETNNAKPNLCSGLGHLYFDAKPGADNFNNTRTGFARLDETCLRTVYDGRTEAHELMHMLGGVQITSPNATPYGHCRDEGDRMCYDDDGSGPVRMRLRCSAANDLRFDCGNDDYFYADAPCGAGGFLNTHWNTADSRWLEHRPASATAPPPNDRPTSASRLSGYAGSVSGTNVGAGVEPSEAAPAGGGGGHSIWYSWTAPVSGRMSFDTCGSDIDTLLGVYTGSASSVSSLALVGEVDDDSLMGNQGRVSFTATAGTTYLIAVDGKFGDEGAVDLRWGAPFHGYRDVKLGAWYEASVNWTKRFGILDPATSTTFGPRGEMTRSQVVDALWRLADRPAARTTTRFSDVPANAKYRPALNWAIENRITQGFADGTFHPNNKVKRGQFVAMLWNLAGRPTASPISGFPDVAPTDKLAPAVSWARAQGLITPFPDNTFRAKKTLTRQQVAAILFDFAGTKGAWVTYPASAPSTVIFAR